MQIKLEIPEYIRINIVDTKDNLLQLKNSIGKLTKYDMMKAGMSPEEVYALVQFHIELQGILSRL